MTPIEQLLRPLARVGRRSVSGPAYEIDPGTGCWNWRGKVDRGGYAVRKIDGKTVGMARLIAQALADAGDAGRVVDHLCRNRRCVNPEHLELVSNTVNLRRGVGTKLTPQQVMALREDYRCGMFTFEALGQKYGIAGAHAHAIVRRKNWKDLA